MLWVVILGQIAKIGIEVNFAELDVEDLEDVVLGGWS